MSTIMRLQGVCQAFRAGQDPIRPVTDVDLDVSAGEWVGLRGASGCGKTTLLLCAGGLRRPDKGTVTIAGRDLYALPPRARGLVRADQLGFVFQSFQLVPYLDARRNLLLARGGPTAGPERGRRADELLERVGLVSRAGHLPAQLSAGERQRVAIARALFARPALVLADEPTGNLDEDTSGAVLELLEGARQDGAAILMASHGAAELEHADRVISARGGGRWSPVAETSEARG